MYHHLEFKYLNPFYVHSFHSHLSRMHAPSCSYHSFLQLTRTLTSCFSYPRKHGLSTSPLRSVTLSLSLYITRFSLSLTSLLFSRITRYLSFLFHRHTHSLHSSFTLSFSLWDSLTHPICLYIWLIPLKLLSLSTVDTIFVAVSFSSPSQTDIIHLFTDQTNSPPPSHTHTTPASTPLPDYRLSLTHTKLSLSHPDSYFSHKHLSTS